MRKVVYIGAAVVGLIIGAVVSVLMGLEMLAAGMEQDDHEREIAEWEAMRRARTPENAG